MHTFYFQKKITLPKLESLKVLYTVQLVSFTGLKLLKNIGISHWNEMIDLDDIFDPSKILDLQIWDNIKTP
jgi:hypothetical protein